MSLRRSALLLSLSAVCAVAQTTAAKSPPPPPGPIHAVVVAGNRIYKTADILRVLNLKVGDPSSAAAYRAAESRLLDTNLFSNVSFQYRWSGKPAEYTVTFTVTEYAQLLPMRFEDLGVADDAMRKYLAAHVEFYNDRIPGSDAVLERYTEAVQEYVATVKPALKVKGYVSQDDAANPEVVFRPDVPLPTIANVMVTGNEAIDTATLQRALNDVAVGQRLSDAGLNLILNHTLRPLYAAKGYVAISFPKIQNEKSPDSLGYVVHVQIHEGPVFHFGSTAFRGSVLDPDDVRAMMKYKSGQVFDERAVDQLRRSMIDASRRKGYIDAQAEVTPHEDDKHLTVDLVYTLVPGPLYTFQTLMLHGLDIESEPVIRKLWAPQPGKPFNPDYPDFFLKRVREQGLFDNLGTTRSSYTADDATHGVTVNLFFHGAEAEKAKKAEEIGDEPGARQPPPQ